MVSDMMTAEQLKNSILQLAMQGKLVEQRPEEGTGEELYKEIQTEKKRLIREGKVKKKPLSDDEKDDVPFYIPDTWRWVRISEISSVINGDRGKNYPSKSTLSHEGIPFISALNLDGRTVVKDDSLLCVSQEQYARLGSGKLEKGDIVVCIRGSLGKHGRYPFEKGAIASSLVICRQFIKSEVMTLFILSFLDAPLFFDQIKQYDNGTAQPNLAAKNLEQFLIPLPPLAEQKRIVSKIEELMPFVEQYAAASTNLNTLNTTFPDMMKKSILQEAVQGKLVPQDPNDEPASVLLKNIAEEKKRLVKEGRIKKQKPLPEITEDEAPFDIPDSWEWCYVGDLFDHNTGKAMNSSAKQGNKKGSVRRFITTSNLYWNRFDLSTVKEMFFSDDELARCTATKRDILMCEGGAYFGRTAIWNYDYDICFQNHVHRLRPYVKIREEFFYYLFYFYRTTGLMKSKGTAMPGLSSVVLHRLVIPLPPLAEQERIVTKIEELLPCVEKLYR